MYIFRLSADIETIAVHFENFLLCSSNNRKETHSTKQHAQKNHLKNWIFQTNCDKKRSLSRLLWKFCPKKKRAMQRAQLICCNLRNSPFKWARCKPFFHRNHLFWTVSRVAHEKQMCADGSLTNVLSTPINCALFSLLLLEKKNTKKIFIEKIFMEKTNCCCWK